MKSFWNKIGHNYFKKIEQGTLSVSYPCGTTHIYGNEGLPVVDVTINRSVFFKRLALYGDVGFAESYMDGDFDTPMLSDLISLALINSHKLGTKSEDYAKNRLQNLFPFVNRIKHLLRKNSKTRSRKNISEHYDLSNDFFKLMLDDTMMYSSAIFKSKEEDLHTAQKYKIQHLAQKLGIKKGEKVLEIGSGWGAMAIYLAKELECDVTTVTLSVEQKALCEERFKLEEVEAKIDILLKDYRDIEGRFDAIISVEMFEAVGAEYFATFFSKCESLLKPSGVLAMQVITIPDQRYHAYAKSTDFIQKYIFPGGHLPSVHKILEVNTQHTRLNLLHLEEFAEDYARTLHLWQKNFNTKMDEVKALGFDEYFIRMWRMYLSYCESAFITRNIGLVQLVFSRDQNMHLNRGLIS
ncbi:MAG: Cyclopropane-fatty-acyl-phospholipid synthase (EC, plant type [uncultured Sulfurovum sp.]|uniref:Cyclopropane-fatty-acyl-phospholipid synthase (EC, plant type) n=1 Tax=uncultured Sulfurovum sp. TaxID=269237 RepID=A0A6S6TM74_9BACT|nr:MAG: Cyclopropane-fatty-acyl-phospholipid synthase (EC, plant type [uncultured Sulfurovum sp.]